MVFIGSFGESEIPKEKPFAEGLSESEESFSASDLLSFVEVDTPIDPKANLFESVPWDRRGEFSDFEEGRETEKLKREVAVGFSEVFTPFSGFRVI